MATINPYLNFNGNTEEAFTFYKSVFGGEFAAIQHFGETPHAGNLPPAAKDKIMHVALPIGQGNLLMGTDVLEPMDKVTFGTNFSIAIGTESEQEANRIFENLSAGGTVTMPMEKVFWGDYFGMLTDKFGIQWMITYTYSQS
jgi:PhnB protein